jgi:Cu-processing system permease protein
LFVVLFDIALLGAVVVDGDGVFTQKIFPWVMIANPADAFRLWNISATENLALATGMTGAASGLPGWAAPLSLFVWPVIALLAARSTFSRVEP